MLKKVFAFLKFILVGIFWSVFWIGFSQQIIFYVWKFNFISINQWRLIKEFWLQNGTIKSASDYLLFISMMVFLFVWIWGFKKLYKINYTGLLIKPFEYFSSKQIEKYQSEEKHVVIKNLVVGEKVTLEDLIKQKIQEEKTVAVKESENLRQNISQKISERKGK